MDPQLLDDDITVMFADFGSEVTDGIEVKYRHLRSKSYNTKTGVETLTTGDKCIDAIVSPYDQATIGKSHGSLIEGDMAFLCISKCDSLGDSQLRSLPDDPAIGDSIFYGTQEYKVIAFSRDATGRLWEIGGRAIK